MRDLAIKYAILCQRRWETGAPTVPFKTLAAEFANCGPSEVFERFKRYLPLDVQGALRFAFPDKAIANIIQYELEIVLASDPPRLAFAKAALDVESFRLAGGVTREFSDAEHRLIDNLAAWLVDATKHLFKSYTVVQSGQPEAQIHQNQNHTVQMFKEMLKLYADKYAFSNPNALQQLSSLAPMSAFTHAMTADALYKADASRLLFGEDSTYYRAWLHQQMFRNLIAHTVTDYIMSFAA